VRLFRLKDRRVSNEKPQPALELTGAAALELRESSQALSRYIQPDSSAELWRDAKSPSYFSSASTARLPGQGGNLSGKSVLSPSGDNGLPGLATTQVHILRQPV
jgi:hypothetical protein